MLTIRKGLLENFVLLLQCLLFLLFLRKSTKIILRFESFPSSTYEASLHTPLANRSSLVVFFLFVLSTSHFQLVAMNNNGETANTS